MIMIRVMSLFYLMITIFAYILTCEVLDKTETMRWWGYVLLFVPLTWQKYSKIVFFGERLFR